ncbi:MAG TPA: phosphate/phosphite/phosphonate ABC transporter substrate-binding protein [Spirochaetota bacterium]|mgnify:FL=1|jgi:phosphonate transport system substrate-binding protein|nr:MAG: Phosphate-import protein PhnD precursor [Spirochaetes bacterium ADurb.Bin133]HNZ27623.1 phosphate/phosphite/phosphonate ABC transporter substrate-binding protein [Spirochaetota bacterium]
MSIKKYILSFLMMAAFALFLYGEEPKLLVIGVTPWGDRIEMAASYKPFIDYISEELGIPVSLYIAKSYNELGAELADGSVHIGIFSPTAYVQAQDTYSELKYLATSVKNGAPYYYGYIITRADSKIKSIKKLKGKTFCFTDKSSTSGYKYPMLLFKKKKINPEKFFKEIIFVKSHDDSLEAVRKGIVDAGAVSGAFENYIHKDELRALDKTPPIPLDAVVVNKSLDGNLIKKIKKLFLSVNPNSKNANNELILSKLYFQGFVEKSNSFYNVVRDMLKEFNE